MWGHQSYGETVRYLRGRVADEEAFIEQVQNVTAKLRQGESYFHVEKPEYWTAKEEETGPRAVGISANGYGYVFARHEASRRDTQELCFMKFERKHTGRNHFLNTTAYAEGLKFGEDELPTSRYAHNHPDLFYRLLEDVSPHPERDVQIIDPDYAPPPEEKIVVTPDDLDR